MSLSQEAIQEISELSVRASGVHTINLDSTDSKTAVLPDGTKIVSLERFNKHRDQFRGEFITTNLDSFIEYNKKQNGDNVTCFINADDMQAKTIFDLGTELNPLHCRHTATLKIKRSMPYDALLEFVNYDRVDQSALAEFIEDWSDFITCYSEADDGSDGYKEVPNKYAMLAVRSVKIETLASIENEIGDFARSSSLMQQTEAKSAHGKKLPVYIRFKCIPSVGLEEREFNVRISASTSGQTPMFSSRIINLEKHIEEMSEEFMQKLQEHLTENEIKIYVGVFDKN